jgi:peptidoglycan/xylan/chitin deacetylase (PgdA/CDA1 family)
VCSVALTFDDGPDPVDTPRILDVLGERDVRATFFIWGEQAQVYPDVVRAIFAAGHGVQPHCWRHVSHWNLDAAAICEDIDRVTALLADLGAPTPTLWRTPHGQLLKDVTRSIAADRGLALAGWTINTADYSGKPGAEMYRDAVREIDAQTEPVVLMHDGYSEPAQNRTDASNTIDLLRRLLGRDDVFAALDRGVEHSLWEGPPRRRLGRVRRLRRQIASGRG